MKIVDIKTVVVNARMRNWVFVKVETDTPGLDGWGEASLEWKTRAVAAAVDDLKPFIVFSTRRQFLRYLEEWDVIAPHLVPVADPLVEALPGEPKRKTPKEPAGAAETPAE